MKKAVLFALALAGPASVRADVDPGIWEVSATMTVAGMPGALGPFTDTRCLEQKEANDPGQLFGPATGASSCVFGNRNDTGSAYSLEVTCGGAVPLRGTGSVRYGSDFMDGTLQLTGTSGGQALSTVTQVKARRLGPCR